MVRRKHPPFEGQYTLPGGFIETGETTEQAARRELKEETGVGVGPLRLVGVYSDPGRDPRAHTVSIAYLGEVEGASPADSAAAEFVADRRNQILAFDHAKIVSDARALRANR